METILDCVGDVCRTANALRITALVTMKLLSAMTFAEGVEGHAIMVVERGERCFFADGLPNHETGTFPNPANPNAIAPRDIDMCVTATPTKHDTSQRKGGVIGIAMNGVQFRPGTADFYDGANPRGHSRDRRSGWRLVGLNPHNSLGMDSNNAHVGPDGLYHYHGIPDPVADAAGDGPIGYAADGFPIYRAGPNERSSYVLKTGIRPSGPGGAYDGTYEEDFAFVAGAGMLDVCNAGERDGKFAYFATEAYPFLPRCLWGEPSADFGRPDARPRPGAEFAQADRGRGEGGRRPRRGPPPEAVSACEGLADGARCSFTEPRESRIVSGTCGETPPGDMACRPDDAPPPPR